MPVHRAAGDRDAVVGHRVRARGALLSSGMGTNPSMDAVLFDLFGTLVPNMAPAEYWTCVEELAGILHAPQESFREVWSASFPERMRGTLRDGAHLFGELLGRLGLPADPGRVERAVACWDGYHQRAVEPRDGAIECLDQLRRRGCRLGLVTDCSTRTPELLDRTALGAYFPVRAASALLGITKPDPAVYEHVLSGLGVRGERCLYVGDGNSGELPGARSHGMTTVWMDNGGAQHWKHEFVGAGDYTVTDLRQVPSIVDRLRGGAGPG